MKNYRFPTQGIELTNAFLENIKSVYDLNKGGELVVSAVINSNGTTHENIYLGTMDDSVDWTNESIVLFAETELKKCEV
jgi:hypothetical protein